MKNNALIFGSIIGLLVSTPVTYAGWQDFLQQTIEQASQPSSVSEQPMLNLSNAEIIAGLKQALQQGAEMAIQQLSAENGYLNDPQVFIPMPGMLSSISQSLRNMGQDKLVDNFEATMNHAAEDAVKQGLNIFINVIEQMSIADAQEILQGADDAATQYFREKSATQLNEAMLPIVKSATDTAGVTMAYKALLEQAGSFSSFLNTSSMDLDAHVTQKAIDGLFLKMAEEEKRIRENPLARSSDLLKKVFGAVN